MSELLPLAIDGLMKDSIDDITIKATISIDSIKSRAGQKAKYVQIVRSAENQIFLLCLEGYLNCSIAVVLP